MFSFMIVGDQEQDRHKAKTACEISEQGISDHFVGVNKMVKLGSGSQREVDIKRLRPIDKRRLIASPANRLGDIKLD